MTVVVTDPISSPANPRLKAAAELRDRRARERTGLTIVDGAREVRRALDAGWEVVEAFVCAPLLAGADARAALDALTARGIATIPVTERAFAKVAFGDRAEGLVAVVRVPPQDLDGLQLPPEPLLVVLEAVEKPGNLGAVLRSADGAGADAVVGASPRTDLANPNVIRASAGTSFHVPTAADSAEAVLAWLRDRRIRPLAARVDAALPYTAADLTGPIALVLGAEAVGLTPLWDAPDVEPIRLPMHGIADSLNVSVTAAILLYEARRQRDAHHRPEDA
jgi:TrmH family RNA methyltransferase